MLRFKSGFTARHDIRIGTILASPGDQAIGINANVRRVVGIDMLVNIPFIDTRLIVFPESTGEINSQFKILMQFDVQV